MPRFVRLYVEDEAEFTDEVFAFVTDPSANSRNARPVILELNDLAPEMVDVLESMILDGVEEREYVADYVHAIVTGEGLVDAPGGPAI
jgi:hypothetical protein